MLPVSSHYFNVEFDFVGGVVKGEVAIGAVQLDLKNLFLFFKLIN